MLLEVYFGKNFKKHKNSSNITKQLNELYLKLFYKQTFDDVVEIITETKQILNTLF